MKIALIHCPLGHQYFSENLSVVDEEFCLAPPIILAYVAAILEKAGHEVIIVEANALRLSKERALTAIREFSPDIVGFRADSYWFHRVVEWATYFKQHVNATIIVGGINISLYPFESLSHNCFDYGIAGEANESLPNLLKCLESGESPEWIAGLIYRLGKEVRFNPPSSGLVDFDDYPFPARHLLPNNIYSSFTSQRKNFTILLTNTGCHFVCSFCAINRQPLRCRSPQNIVDEMEQCYRDFGIREIDFFSPSFFINRELALETCEKIIKRNIGIEWSCRSRIDEVDEELLRQAYKAGCRRIYYGIESASSEVLGNISKGITLDQIANAIAMSRRFKIKTLGFFMIGNPGDTKESILDTIEFSKRLKLDYIQVCRTIAKPNTALNDFVINNTGQDYWRKYIVKGDERICFPTPWISMTREELDNYVKRFYRSFYFRPLYIIKLILDVKSIPEFLRYCKVACKWLLFNNRD